MVADEQTHMLPEDDEGLERIARMLRLCRCGGLFEAALPRRAADGRAATMRALFETAPELSAGVGNLVFTGDVDDPDTLADAERARLPAAERHLPRRSAAGISAATGATRSAEARERLTELTPALLKAFGQTRRADEALIRFDEFLAGLPAGIQLFSLLQSNPALLKLMATIMGAAPRLAAIITRRPHVFDGLLDPALLSELPDRGYLVGAADGASSRPPTAMRSVLDRLRIFAAEQKFLIGVRLLAGIDRPAGAPAAPSPISPI